MSLRGKVPRSRINSTYNTQIDGKPAPVELPHHLVFRDFSSDISKKQKVDLEGKNLEGLNEVKITSSSISPSVPIFGAMIKFLKQFLHFFLAK